MKVAEFVFTCAMLRKAIGLPDSVTLEFRGAISEDGDRSLLFRVSGDARGLPDVDLIASDGIVPRVIPVYSDSSWTQFAHFDLAIRG
jgi:hypothetical protein